MPHQRSCVQSERAGASGYRAGSPARGAARVGRMGRPRGGAELPITDAVSLQYRYRTWHTTMACVHAHPHASQAGQDSSRSSVSEW